MARHSLPRASQAQPPASVNRIAARQRATAASALTTVSLKTNPAVPHYLLLLLRPTAAPPAAGGTACSRAA